jgi:HSP20 family molecular chaperone IbpA
MAAKREEIFGVHPLSPALKAQKLELLGQLSQFWASPGFANGMSTPPFQFHDVKAELDDACDIATRIHAYCVTKHPQMRSGPGAALEYLWGLQSMPEDKGKFVESLVEAIFSNSNGFEAPLDQALLTRYIGEIRELRKSHQHTPVHVLKSEWAASELLLDEVLHSGEVTQEHMDAVTTRLRDLNLLLETIARRNKDVAAAAVQREADERERAREVAAAKVAADEAEKQQQEAEAKESAKAAAEKADSEKAEGGEVASQKVETEKKEEKEEGDESDAESSGSGDERSRMKASIDRNAQNPQTLLELQRISEKTSEISRDVQSFEEVDLKRLDDPELSDAERDGLIARLNKRAMQYAVLLERELLQLDAISGDSVRMLRKEQVGRIQNALQHVDSLQKRLKDIHAVHQEAVDKKREEENAAKGNRSPSPAAEVAAAAAPAPNAAPAAASPASNSPPQKKAEKKLSFVEQLASMKLEVPFQIKDRPHSFLISAYVPGIDERTLSISLNDEGDMLTCSGLRLPSPQELDALRSHPAVARMRNQEEGVLRLAAGRFGRFSEKWRMDANVVDADKISASYNSGVLEIVVPKKAVQQRKQPHFQPQRGYGGYPFGW